jgi:hypothetical protein
MGAGLKKFYCNFENAAKFKHVDLTVIKEIIILVRKCGANILGNACYHVVQNCCLSVFYLKM